MMALRIDGLAAEQQHRAKISYRVVCVHAAMVHARAVSWSDDRDLWPRDGDVHLVGLSRGELVALAHFPPRPNPFTASVIEPAQCEPGRCPRLRGEWPPVDPAGRHDDFNEQESRRRAELVSLPGVRAIDAFADSGGFTVVLCQHKGILALAELAAKGPPLVILNEDFRAGHLPGPEHYFWGIAGRRLNVTGIGWGRLDRSPFGPLTAADFAALTGCACDAATVRRAELARAQLQAGATRKAHRRGAKRS